MATAKKAEVKLEEGGFNNMPGKEQVLTMLELSGVEYSVVDLDAPAYWENANDTLVIAFERLEVWRLGEATSMAFAIWLAKFIEQNGCDEFDTYTIGKRTAMRFWWD